MEELINDPIIKVKVTESTNILMDLYELGFNNGLKLSQSQLNIANNKLKEVKEKCNKIQDKIVNEQMETELNYGEGLQWEITSDILSIIGSD